jgi:Xaa-Pro aminopeptidase
MKEFELKMKELRALLVKHKLDALHLSRVSSFAWATCGAASYVNTATSEGTASLLVLPNELHLITNNIEAPRLEQEEQLKKQGWEFHVTAWHATQNLVARLTKGKKLGADTPGRGSSDLSVEMARLRINLTAEEGDRFRHLSRLCASAMNSAIRAVHPYQTEHEIAAMLAQEAERRGVQAIVNLVATDGRIYAYRHPLPTVKRLERYAMLVLCGRRAGLVCSITRLIHFGSVPEELSSKSAATARVDATFIFKEAQAAYADTGYPDEWRLHHQGGPASYEPREVIATAASEEIVRAGQVYAWNPSITGTKSEDTILIGENGNEVLTTIEDWPMLAVEIDGQIIQRPAILEML